MTNFVTILFLVAGYLRETIDPLFFWNKKKLAFLQKVDEHKTIFFDQFFSKREYEEFTLSIFTRYLKNVIYANVKLGDLNVPNLPGQVQNFADETWIICDFKYNNKRYMVFESQGYIKKQWITTF